MFHPTLETPLADWQSLAILVVREGLKEVHETIEHVDLEHFSHIPQVDDEGLCETLPSRALVSVELGTGAVRPHRIIAGRAWRAPLGLVTFESSKRLKLKT